MFIAGGETQEGKLSFFFSSKAAVKYRLFTFKSKQLTRSGVQLVHIKILMSLDKIHETRITIRLYHFDFKLVIAPCTEFFISIVKH